MRIRCGHCKQPMEIPDDRRGELFACPTCGKRVRLARKKAQEGNRPAGPRAAGPPRDAPKRGEASDVADRERHTSPSAATTAEGDALPTIRFTAEPGEDDDLDMTPMVDVTFLLLIFFMITASFALQKSLETPPPDREESSAQAPTLEEIEQDDDFIIVRIAKDNTVWVDDREAPSEQDLLVKLRAARGGQAGVRGPSSLLVLADGECRHETVVMALDAGNSVGIENVRLARVDESDF